MKNTYKLTLLFSVIVLLLASCKLEREPGPNGDVFVKFTWNETAKTLVSYQITGESNPTVTTGFPSGTLANGVYYLVTGTVIHNDRISAHFVFSDATTYTFTKKFEADPGVRSVSPRTSGFNGPSGQPNYYTVNLDGLVEVITVSHNP